MRFRLLTLLFSLLCASSAFAQDRFVPHVTDLDNDFQTWIIIENLGMEQEVLQANSFDEGGYLQPFSLEGLQPGETKILRAQDFVANSTTSHFTIGSVTYPSPNLRLFVAYGRKDDKGSRVTIPQMTETATAWRFYTGTWPVVYDAVAVINFGGEPTEIRIIQRANDGSPIKEITIAAEAPPMNKTKYLIGGPVSEFDNTASSIFEVRASQPLGLVALQGSPDSTLMWVNTARPLPH